jgi:hypothetical protein
VGEDVVELLLPLDSIFQKQECKNLMIPVLFPEERELRVDKQLVP